MIADSISRLSYHDLQAMCGIWSSPRLGALGEPATPPFSRLGTPEQRGRGEKDDTPTLDSSTAGGANLGPPG